MDSNLEVEVGRVFEQRGRGGGGRESRSGHVIRETLISFGRNHDRSSRQLPRGTASYTNSRPQHRVWEGFNVTAARTGEFIVICNRGRSSFSAVRLSAALRGVHPLCCPSDRNSLLPCRTAIARSVCTRIRANPWTAWKIHRYRRTHRTDSRLTRLSAQTRNQFRSNPDQRYFARRALTPPPTDWRIPVYLESQPRLVCNRCFPCFSDFRYPRTCSPRLYAIINFRIYYLRLATFIRRYFDPSSLFVRSNKTSVSSSPFTPTELVPPLFPYTPRHRHAFIWNSIFATCASIAIYSLPIFRIFLPKRYFRQPVPRMFLGQSYKSYFLPMLLRLYRATSTFAKVTRTYRLLNVLYTLHRKFVRIFKKLRAGYLFLCLHFCTLKF